jgi:hypothetical protein
MSLEGEWSMNKTKEGSPNKFFGEDLARKYSCLALGVRLMEDKQTM